jgi:hypothetical protein
MFSSIEKERENYRKWYKKNRERIILYRKKCHSEKIETIFNNELKRIREVGKW